MIFNKKALLCLAALVPALYWQNDADKADVIPPWVKKMKQIRTLIDLLDSTDEKSRLQAYEDLMRMDPDEVIPHIEEKLSKSPFSLHYELLRRAYKKFVYHTSVSVVSEGEIKNNLTLLEEECKKRGNKYIGAKVIDIGKMIEAGKLSGAIDKLEAIERLETGEIIAISKKLRIILENDLFNQTIMKSFLQPAKDIYVAGETPSITVKISNLRENDFKVLFPPNTYESIIIKISVTEYDIYLNSSTMYMPTSRQLRDIELSSMGSWDAKFNLDELKSLELRHPLAVCTVEAMFYPTRIETGNSVFYKKIMFQPARFLIVHPLYKDLINEPLKEFTSLVKQGTIEEVFTCAVICAYSNKLARSMAITVLTEILKTIDTGEKPLPSQIVQNMLTLMTGKNFKTKEDWLKWWDIEKTRDKGEPVGSDKAATAK